MTTLTDILAMPGLNEMIVRGIGSVGFRAVNRQCCSLSGFLVLSMHRVQDDMPFVFAMVEEALYRPDRGPKHLEDLLKVPSNLKTAKSNPLDEIGFNVWEVVFGDYHEPDESKYCHAAIVKVLLEAGVSPNLVDNFKGTALHWAVSDLVLYTDDAIWKPPLHIVEMMIAHGGNLNSRDRSGSTPVESALKSWACDLPHDFDVFARYPCLKT